MKNVAKSEFQGLKALFLNCTLKRSPEMSHSKGIIDISKSVMEVNGISCQVIRPVDLNIATGIQPDMTENGWDKDDWPELYKKILDSDILVIASPIWLGEKSSVCTQLIERLYSNSADLNQKGQFVYYGKAGGCIISGNEDGAKHCSMNILYSLQHLGFLIPPSADSYWVGEAGPGPSYRDKNSGGPENDFTNRNTTFMTWNLMHAAKLLREKDGFPAYGNQPEKWNEGIRPGFVQDGSPSA